MRAMVSLSALVSFDISALLTCLQSARSAKLQASSPHLEVGSVHFHVSIEDMEGRARSADWNPGSSDAGCGLQAVSPRD